MFGSPNASLYSNRIIGLPHSPEFLTTIVKLDEPRRPTMFSSSSSSSDNDSGGDDTNNSNDEEMQNVSSDHETQNNREDSIGSGKSGPSVRPTSHGPKRHHSLGVPSSWAGKQMGPTTSPSISQKSLKEKGKGVISINKPSFKRSRRKNSGKCLGVINELQSNVASSWKAADGNCQPGFHLSRFLSPISKLSHTHFISPKPGNLVKSHHIGSFLPLNHNTINRSLSSLSSFKSFPPPQLT